MKGRIEEGRKGGRTRGKGKESEVWREERGEGEEGRRREGALRKEKKKKKKKKKKRKKKKTRSERREEKRQGESKDTSNGSRVVWKSNGKREDEATRDEAMMLSISLRRRESKEKREGAESGRPAHRFTNEFAILFFSLTPTASHQIKMSI